MMNRIKFLIIIISLIFLIGFGCSSSSETSIIEMYKYLPYDAYNIKHLGNDWIEFELNENKFMYHRYEAGNSGFECITQINKNGE